MKPRDALAVLTALSFGLARLEAQADVASSDARDAFFRDHVIPRIRIHLDPSAIAALDNRMREYVKATVYERTNTYHDVGLHLKGQYGTFQGLSGKPSLTLNFDKYIKKQRFHGLDKLHLNNSIQDPSFLCEKIGRELFRQAGVPTGRATHARVELNGRDLGLFVLVEGYDRTFLQRHLGSSTGNLYDSEFRHEIIDPIKRSSGQGVSDHSDLAGLALVAEDPEHTTRLARLPKCLELDRFQTMMALETLIRHHDGYSMGINNYRVYFDPLSGRATFLPGGMDQLFFEPYASVLPPMRGVVSRRILETQAGRATFREKCSAFYTNLFPTLSNRVTRIREKMSAVLFELGPEMSREINGAATNLLERIGERTRHLAAELAAEAYAPRFDHHAAVTPTNWAASIEGGRATMTRTNENGEAILLIRLGRSGTQATARWQSRLLLSPGRYLFAADVEADTPVFRGPNPTVGLQIWGISNVELDSQRQSATAMKLECLFSVEPAAAGEYVLQCQAKGVDALITYRFKSPRLTRLP